MFMCKVSGFFCLVWHGLIVKEKHCIIFFVRHFKPEMESQILTCNDGLYQVNNNSPFPA